MFPPFFQKQIFENNPTLSLSLRAQSRLWGRSEKSISLSDQPERTCVARGARLRIPANLEPSQVSQLEKVYHKLSGSRARKVGFSEAFPELDFHRAQATENRERGIIRRKDRERRSFRGGESLLCCHVSCRFTSIYFTLS